jgi:holo-[acyl-carrier protein] synthase
MIVGLGSDLIDIPRIEKALARFGKKFEDRIFTAQEQAAAAKRSGAGAQSIAATYAKRFAAKEACAKALGTGIGRIAWLEIEVGNLASGAPTLTLSGAAREALAAITPAGMSAHIWLTLSDEYPLAMAQVILEARAP